MKVVFFPSKLNWNQVIRVDKISQYFFSAVNVKWSHTPENVDKKFFSILQSVSLNCARF